MSSEPADHARAYHIAGLTIRIEAGSSINRLRFAPQVEKFRCSASLNASSASSISLHHHFSLPDLLSLDYAHKVYDRPPWDIYRQDSSWIYVGKSIRGDPYLVGLFNNDHSAADIYHPGLEQFLSKKPDALSLFPTDQIWLARLLAARHAFYLHAAGLVINGQGLAFVGHSEAGKSTIARMLQDRGDILCDDRIILRRWPSGFKLHGTWSHGELHIVSPGEAPLRAVLLLEQATENRLVRLQPVDVVRSLPLFVIKPLVTRDWWEQVLDSIGALAREIPVYRLLFDRSGRVWETLQELL